jgi:hypothetical protein
MKANDRALVYLLAHQQDVLARAQARAAGVTDSGLRYRLRPGGPWRRMLPGVYATFTGTPTIEQREIAAMLYAGAPAVITGPAALRNYEIRGPRVARVDVLVPASRERASRGYVVIHRTQRMPQTITVDGTRQYALPARAVADTILALADVAVARTAVGSAVQQRRCTIEELAAELAAGPIRGSRLLRSVLIEVSDGIRSAPEGDLRMLIIGSGLPAPLYNRDLFVRGKFLARPDAWWPHAGVVAEVDSRAFHLLPEHWEQTMRRHRRMEAAGIRVLHFSPRQLATEPEQIVRDIRDALAVGRPLPWISAGPAAA